MKCEQCWILKLCSDAQVHTHFTNISSEIINLSFGFSGQEYNNSKVSYIDAFLYFAEVVTFPDNKCKKWIELLTDSLATVDNGTNIHLVRLHEI